MEIYSSNKNNSVLQDLGPFKIINADNSVTGKSVYSYSTTVEVVQFGQAQVFGNKRVIGQFAQPIKG